MSTEIEQVTKERLTSLYCAAFYTMSLACSASLSVGIAGRVGGFNPPVHFFNPPSLIYSFVLGESENNPPDCTCIHCLCHHRTSTISVSSLSKILYKYSIMIAVKIENLWFLVNYNYVQLICTLRSLDRSWKIYFLKSSK